MHEMIQLLRKNVFIYSNRHNFKTNGYQILVMYDELYKTARNTRIFILISLFS